MKSNTTNHEKELRSFTDESIKQFAEHFKEFLQSYEGDVYAAIVADVWNNLSYDNDWDEFLMWTDKEGFEK